MRYPQHLPGDPPSLEALGSTTTLLTLGALRFKGSTAAAAGTAPRTRGALRVITGGSSVELSLQQPGVSPSSESTLQVLPGRKLSLASCLAALILHSRQDPDKIWICLRDRSLYPKHTLMNSIFNQGKPPHLFGAVPVSSVPLNPSDLDITMCKSYSCLQLYIV